MTRRTLSPQDGTGDSIEDINKIMETLLSHEVRWRDRCHFLESRGYQLRPRFRPGWVPSWRGTGKLAVHFEDSHCLPVRPHLIDATRASDGELVYIKRVQTGGSESQIALFLSSYELRNGPRNHCVPIIDFFRDSDDDSISYMVMPFLRHIDHPEFGSVGELLEFGDQIFEGLIFTHEHGIAHRDCAAANIMMDAKAMYPMGFHPASDFMDPTMTHLAPYFTRSECPVKYYYTDFGLSVYIPPDRYPKLAVGWKGRDRKVPELSRTVPCDPFKTDIFIIGNLFKTEFLNKYLNVNFLTPLVTALAQQDPSQRPDACGALET